MSSIITQKHYFHALVLVAERRFTEWTFYSVIRRDSKPTLKHFVELSF